MLVDAESVDINVVKIPGDVARVCLIGALESYVGHADTAIILSGILGMEVPFNRANATIQQGETVVVAQYRGPRLPEGATQLPAGAEMNFLLVTVKEEGAK
jgi:hypothetical protein